MSCRLCQKTAFYFGFAWFLVFAMPVFAAASAKLHEPSEIVTELYRITAGPKGDYDGPSAFEDKQIRVLYFSKSLRAAVIAMEKKSKKTDEVILDFDPITDSQAPSVKNLSIKEESRTDSKATVAAQFWYSLEDKVPFIVRYDFIKEGTDWKLDDIRGKSDDKEPVWSLREIIKK
jgi:hypothetical protein